MASGHIYCSRLGTLYGFKQFSAAAAPEHSPGQSEAHTVNENSDSVNQIQGKTMSNPEIISELGRRFKEYRLSAMLTQKEAAERAGVSLITLRQFENGRSYNINMNNFLAMLRVVGCLEQVDELLPEMPVSAYAMDRLMQKNPKRIRHGK